MSEQVKVVGFVEKIFPKEGTNGRGPWRAYSLKVQKPDGNVDPRYYQFGFVEYLGEGKGFAPYPFKEGDYVEFSATIKDEKSAVFVEGSGRKPKNPPARPAKPAGQGGGGDGKGGWKGKGGGGGYKPREPINSAIFGKIGGNNTEDDIRRMSYTAARTAALDAVSLLLANDALPMSAAKTKAGQAARYEEVTAAIDKLTVEYFHDAALGRKLSTVADAGSKESRVAELPTAEAGKGPAPAASEDTVADEMPPDVDENDAGPDVEDDDGAF